MTQQGSGLALDRGMVKNGARKDLLGSEIASEFKATHPATQALNWRDLLRKGGAR